MVTVFYSQFRLHVLDVLFCSYPTFKHLIETCFAIVQCTSSTKCIQCIDYVVLNKACVCVFGYKCRVLASTG